MKSTNSALEQLRPNLGVASFNCLNQQVLDIACGTNFQLDHGLGTL